MQRGSGAGRIAARKLLVRLASEVTSLHPILYIAIQAGSENLSRIDQLTDMY